MNASRRLQCCKVTSRPGKPFAALQNHFPARKPLCCTAKSLPGQVNHFAVLQSHFPARKPFCCTAKSGPELLAREACPFGHCLKLCPDHRWMHLGAITGLRGETTVPAGDYVFRPD